MLTAVEGNSSEGRDPVSDELKIGFFGMRLAGLTGSQGTGTNQEGVTRMEEGEKKEKKKKGKKNKREEKSRLGAAETAETGGGEGGRTGRFVVEGRSGRGRKSCFRPPGDVPDAA